MNAIRMVVALLVGGAMVAGCNDRSTPTSSSDASASFAVSEGSGMTSVVTDPVGDASLNVKKNVGPGADAKVPDYLDVVRAEIARQGRTFVFTMNVADIIPSNPTAASGGAEAAQAWVWGLDIDPTTFPAGGPFPSNQSSPYEFFVDVEWDGARFSGLLYDRRPLLSGGALVVTPVQFAIDGALLTVSVAASALGDPATFGWASGTLTRHSLGTDSIQPLDIAPDAGLATWPQ